MKRRTVMKGLAASAAAPLMARRTRGSETDEAGEGADLEAEEAEPRSVLADGFYLPEEGVAHERTFMQWPVNRQVHSDPTFLALLQRTIASIANAIAAFEPVVMLMDKRHEAEARTLLSAAVEIWDIPTDDLWCRDSGPAFVVDGIGGIAVTQFNFNGWGGVQEHGQDGLVAARVAERLGLTVYDNGLVGEPGGVETDGNGTLLAHESSWVDPARNAGGRDEIEALLLDAMGAEAVIWAPGLAGADITDFHIDALARFVEPGRIVMQVPEFPDPDDPFAGAALETREVLRRALDAKGRSLEIVEIVEPFDIRVETEDFVASYVNYYVCNGAVIAAEFGDEEADARAAETLRTLYPNRELVTLNTDPLGEVGGGIHCATREQPKV